MGLGYNAPLGMTHVDFKTQQRTPKQSFRWYQKAIQENSIV